MANRYDIIRIDFQASAKGANTAIDSIRQEAEQCNNRITELKKNIAEAPKGTDAKVLQGWNDELKMTEKRFKQFNTAYRELIKGMRALDEGVKMFNDGSLSQMNAAFQKTVNNAAKLAQSKLQTGSNEWRQMGALMQETEQNYARMQRDTDQLIESLQNGGTVFLKTIEDEKKGLQDLLKVLPYMGTEYRKAEEQLQFLVKTTDEMSIKERQLKGEIVTTDDARRVSIQLTEKGAEAARQRAEAADQEIEKGKQEIETLEKEREAREANARASAQAAADYRENQRMHEDEIERLDAEMRKEEALANSKKNGLDALQRKAANMKDAAEAEKKTQQELDGVYDAAKEKVAKLREEVEKLRQGATSTTAKDTVAEAVKEGAEEASAAIKQEAEAKKEEAKAGEEVAETNKKEAESAESLKKKHESLVEETRKLIAERETLTKERDGLVRTLEAEAAAAEKAANAFASLSKEEAEAMLKERQATITKGADGKFSYTNAENAQHFLIESMRQVNPANAKGDALSLDSAGVAKVRAMFKERFGLQSDDDALAAIRGLLSGGENSLIKGGMMNNAFSRIDIDTSKVTAYSKIIKDLTEVINGEVKAIEGESEAKKKLEQVDTRLLELDEKIDANDKASREIFQQRRAMMGSAASATETLTEKTDELSESKRKNVEATNAQIEAIKKMSAEEAKAAKDAMNEVSTVGYKANKLDMSNPEEVQSWLISQMIKRGASVSQDGTLSVGGQNIDGILSSFKERYQLKGDNQKAKSLFKEIVQGKGGGGLLREGGVVDFSADTLMVKANTEAYQGRVAVLKELIKITNKASYEAAHSTETTERDTQAVKDVTEATKELTAIEKQELEVKRLKEAYDKSKDEYEKMKDHLSDLKRKKSGLPGGMDAALERESLTTEISDYDENVRKPKGREVTKLKNQWQKAAQKLAQMQAEETTAENQNTEATERNTQAKGRKAKASEAASKATGEETQKSAELLAKEKQLKDAEEEEATAKKNAEEQQKKTTKAVNDATDAETKASDAEKKYTETMKGLNDERQKHVDGLKELNEANKDTIATNEKNQKLLEETNGKILEQGERIRAAEQIKAQAKTDGIEKTEQAIRLLKEENDRIDQNSFTWKRNTIEIQHLQEALDEMKGKPALMMMEQRMKNVGALSASAVTETKKFWETMVAGAENGSEKLKEAEKHLAAITEEEQKRNLTAMKSSSDRLSGNIGLMSQGDIRQAIEDAKKYQLTLGSTSEEAKKLAQAIVNAEEHLKRYGVEAERAARKQEEADKKAERAARDKEEVEAKAQQDQLRMMRERIVFEKQRQSLSADALAETKKYWEAVARGANEGSWTQKNALTMMERITAEEERRAKKKNVEKADRLIGTRYLTLSESELRESIEAARELQKELSPTESLYKSLSKQIAIAEEHIKKYGVEAQRVAVREAQEAREAKQAFEDAVAGKFDKASMEELDEVIKKIKEYQATIKDPTGDGAQAFNDAKVQIDALSGRLNALKGVAEKVTGTFAGADDVLARWSEHMNAGKTTSEGMAQTLDEKLAGATSSWDKEIEDAIKDIADYDKELKEAETRLADLEQQMEQATNKAKNRSGIGRALFGYSDSKKIYDLHLKIEGDEDRWGAKEQVEDAKRWKQSAQDNLDWLKQKKAEELRLTESEVQGEEKKADAKRLTNEQMQQGIKLLEEEYAKTDHTTEEGIKKRQQLREAIDQMNQELKESTGEWMKLADAEKLAGQAEKNTFLDNDGTGFTASAQDIQKATQALERQRDALLQTIKTKRDNKNLTKEEKAALDQEEAELQDLTNKLKALKFEQDNFNMSQAKMQELMRTPTNAVSLDELRAAIKRADGELKRMEGSLGQNNAQYKAFAEQVRNAKNQLKEMEGQAKASATAWEKAWSRLKTYVVMYMGFNAAWNKMTSMADDVMELSDKMGEVRKTTQLSAEAVAELSKNLAKLDVRTPLEELMAISASAGQLGLKSVEDIQGFTEAANMLMIALPEMGKEAATEMMRVAIATGEVNKIRKQLEEGTVEGSNATAVAMTKIASTIDRLRASSASTAPEITDFVKRLGAVAAQSGISIDQVAALGSTISSLGMRVEMSATALSRMIPAIKNNAFAIANAIGVTPEALRSLFEAGRGMEAILMIFQHLKEQNANADTIENLLGIGNMKDVMKQLNQQGARAGIVFAGLSQNVDELRKQLVIAGDAYERNTAIQDEFNRMNDTTAAKWERLKNTIEEMVVSDWTQRVLGGLIEGVHKIINLLVGNNGLQAALLTIITLFGILKLNIVSIMWSALAAGLAKIVDLFRNWRIALDLIILKMKEMTAAQWTNVFLAIAAAVAMLIYKLQQLSERAAIVANEMAKANEEILKQTGAVDKLFRSVAKTNAELENAKKRLEEVARAGNDTTESENALKKASSDHAAAIRDINSKYGTYLGYMISETSSAEQLARARELINAKLRETITLKQQEAALGSVEQEYGGKVNKKATDMEKTLGVFYGEDYDTAARVSVAINEAAQKYAKNSKEYQKAVKKILADNKIQKDVAESYMGTFEDYREAIEDYQKQTETVNRRFEATNNINRKQTREAVNKDLNAILGDWKDLVDQYRKAEGEEKEKLAAEVYKQQRAYANAVANNAEYFDGDKRKEVYDQNIKNMKTYEKGLRSVAGEAIRTIDAMERAEGKITGLDLSNDGESNKNPWGGGHDAASTDWKNMTANQLVERRKQMKDFVNAIQTDTDVQSVLKEDAALKKAIENGMSSDMRTVIEWYNTERLKIQDELHARYLTNTGDWMDPKKQRGAHKQFKAELDAYLEELDAYYTERKAEIEKARSDEEITEGEAWRRNLKNENEWYNRRAELLKLYAEKSGEVTQAEQDAIVKIIAERTGDSVEFVRAMIKKTIGFAKQIEASGEKGAAMVHDWYAKIDLKTQQSMLKSQQAITKQVKFIEDTLAKERPYDGITKNLQENLDKMGVLAAKMRRINDELTAQGKEQKYSDAEITAQTYKEMAFYLRQAEEAWSIDIDKLLRRMAEEGMVATAEEISKSDMLKQAVMGQLRKTYQEVQDAVKKEASQIKKNVEIIWNDEAQGIGGKSMKSMFDQAIARLGMQQDSVSRANSLIGAGPASDNVATRLAMKQIEMQMRMQKAQFDMYRVQANQRIAMLKAEAAEHERIARQMKQENNLIEEARQKTLAVGALKDAENVKRSLGLTLAEETKKEEEQMAELLKMQEESQNRLYTSLREWADLLASSLQGVFEASHAGDAEYYNELAKLNLTGKGGPGAGTYIVIDDEGTEDATAHYEYLDERAALERQHEIEVENAQAEAWRKLMDDLNQKMNDQITDWMNAALQNASVDANTQAVIKNTEAIAQATAAMQNGNGSSTTNYTNDTNNKVSNSLIFDESHESGGAEGEQSMMTLPGVTPGVTWTLTEEQIEAERAQLEQRVQMQTDAAERVRIANEAAFHSAAKTESDTDKQMVKSSQSTFAKMTQAANLYGVAYQAMSNDNLDMAQKFEMIALQAVGNAAIAGLQVAISEMTAKTATNEAETLSKDTAEHGSILGPILFAISSALIGGLMGIATSKVAKSKSQIAQVTGASSGAGRLATGMLTYAEGNVNEFSNPDSLTVGRSYNVDGADGKTYRAKYMGKDAKTHITNGPEFHLVGEKGREAIIDAHTTRNIQLNEPEIWGAIKTLYNGGSLRHTGTRRGRGVRNFAEGNVEEFEDVMAGGGGMMAGGVDIAAMTEAMNRQAAVQEALLERLNEPIYARNILYGAEGLPAVLQKLQREAQRHGEKYL